MVVLLYFPFIQFEEKEQTQRGMWGWVKHDQAIEAFLEPMDPKNWSSIGPVQTTVNNFELYPYNTEIGTLGSSKMVGWAMPMLSSFRKTSWSMVGFAWPAKLQNVHHWYLNVLLGTKNGSMTMAAVKVTTVGCICCGYHQKKGVR